MSSLSSFIWSKVNWHVSRGEPPRRRNRWSTKFRSFFADTASFSALHEIRRPMAYLQRWRQRRANTHVRTASCAGRKDNTWWRTSSGSTSMLTRPPPEAPPSCPFRPSSSEAFRRTDGGRRCCWYREQPRNAQMMQGVRGCWQPNLASQRPTGQTGLPSFSPSRSCFICGNFV